MEGHASQGTVLSKACHMGLRARAGPVLLLLCLFIEWVQESFIEKDCELAVYKMQAGRHHLCINTSVKRKEPHLHVIQKTHSECVKWHGIFLRSRAQRSVCILERREKFRAKLSPQNSNQPMEISMRVFIWKVGHASYRIFFPATNHETQDTSPETHLRPLFFIFLSAPPSTLNNVLPYSRGVELGTS